MNKGEYWNDKPKSHKEISIFYDWVHILLVSNGVLLMHLQIICDKMKPLQLPHKLDLWDGKFPYKIIFSFWPFPMGFFMCFGQFSKDTQILTTSML
jgi:hypothetical protein